MRKPLNRNIVAQDGKCAACNVVFTDYNVIARAETVSSNGSADE